MNGNETIIDINRIWTDFIIGIWTESEKEVIHDLIEKEIPYYKCNVFNNGTFGLRWFGTNKLYAIVLDELSEEELSYLMLIYKIETIDLTYDVHKPRGRNQ